MTDAIAGISGGTEIKYVDTKTGIDVSRYGNILGAMPLFGSGSRTTTRLILTVTGNRISFGTANTNGLDNGTGGQPIRVFYFLTS